MLQVNKMKTLFLLLFVVGMYRVVTYILNNNIEIIKEIRSND